MQAKHDDKYDAVTYNDTVSRSGKDVRRWFKIGFAKYGEDGNLYVKLDSLPITFNGYIHLIKKGSGDEYIDGNR